MKHLLKSILISSIVLTTAGISTVAMAQSYGSGTSASASQVDNTFTKKRYSVKGSWNVSQKNGQNVIEFNDDFKTKSGPDLKVYLSKAAIEDLDSDKVEGTSLKLSVLKSNRGTQSYTIPADINLSEYKSVIIHCEAFSVLWGGFNL